MTTTSTQIDSNMRPAGVPDRIDWASLPRLRCEMSEAQAIERLATASKRGRLPGFRRGESPQAFSAAVWGAPFDRELHGAIRATEDGKSIEIRFTSPLLMKVPIIFAAVIVFSIWPGVWLTDSLIPGQWGWPATWMWYLPLTILPLFYYLPKTWKKSIQAAWVSAHEAIAAIAKELGATGVP